MYYIFKTCFLSQNLGETIIFEFINQLYLIELFVSQAVKKLMLLNCSVLDTQVEGMELTLDRVLLA